MKLRWMCPKIMSSDVKEYQDKYECRLIEAKMLLKEKNPVKLQMYDGYSMKWEDVPFETINVELNF